MTDIFERKLLNKSGLPQKLPPIAEDNQLPDPPEKLSGREARSMKRQQNLVKFADRITAESNDKTEGYTR